jgi:hypothetical protein
MINNRSSEKNCHHRRQECEIVHNGDSAEMRSIGSEQPIRNREAFAKKPQ